MLFVGIWLFAVATLCCGCFGNLAVVENVAVGTTLDHRNGRELISTSFWQDLKDKSRLHDNAAVVLQEILGDDWFQFFSISEDDMIEVEVFSYNATIEIDNHGSSQPKIFVLQKKDDPSFVVVLDSDGHLQRVSMKDPATGESKSIVRVPGPSIYLTVKESDVDKDKLTKKATYGAAPPPPEPRPPRASASSASTSQHNGRSLSASCFSFKVIDLAVAYDSTFCKHFGYSAEEATAAVQVIVAGVSDKMSQDGLCMKVKISHLEGFCDPFSDPYRDIVLNATSVCDDAGGLLQRFSTFWNEQRGMVHRDSAQLFHGTPDPMATNNRETIGCAWIGTLCWQRYAYGVNQASYFGNAVLAGPQNLVAHELAHNGDGVHHQVEDPQLIMSPRVSMQDDAKFSFANVEKMRNFAMDLACLETITESPSAGPSERPSVSLAPSGTPSIEPSSLPTAAPSLSSWPTSLPSGNPSVSPTTGYPTTSPTGSPTKSPTATPTQSDAPSYAPSGTPSSGPSEPSASPSAPPTGSPTASPTESPIATPTKGPTDPSFAPSGGPTQSYLRPSVSPSAAPSRHPSVFPTAHPTGFPTAGPTGTPTASPTESPTENPSKSPTGIPTDPSSGDQCPSRKWANCEEAQCCSGALMCFFGRFCI